MTFKFVKTLAPKGFYMVGYGGALNHETGKHKKISIVLGTQTEIYGIGAARTLLVETITEFLNYINSREEIKQYLANVPFTVENIHVSIIFDNAQPGEIVDIKNCGQNLYYNMRNIDPNVIQWVEIGEETFEEAKTILAHEHQQENNF